MRIIKDSEIDLMANEQVLEKPYGKTNSVGITEEYTFIHACNFYKLFWIFMIGSIFGCYMEQIQYYYQKGIWESRAGVIWGPFSEIYGLGGVLLFLLLHKARKTSPLTIFIVSAISGSAFEYIARLFQELVFGSISWDYSGKVLNIGGRTSLEYGIYWGLLGFLFTKWVFPYLSKSLEKMKGRVFLIFTWVLIIFISLDLLTSALAVNRWNERIQGVESIGLIEEFLDNHYGNDKMEQIFPHLEFMDTADTKNLGE